MHRTGACRLMKLGTIDYMKAFALQKNLVRDIIAGKTSSTLLVCDHPHVITLSRRATGDSICARPDELKQRGVAVCCADRGGGVTYHGPGQVILYPIFDLKAQKKDLHLFLRKLEQVVINALRKNFGLNAYRRQDLTGVWVGPYKVASIGIGVRQWVAYHGLALNVKTDPSYFSLIKPCGMDVQMASIGDFFDDAISSQEVAGMLIEEVKEVFDMDVIGEGGDDKSLCT